MPFCRMPAPIQKALPPHLATQQPFLGRLTLTRARVHEFCGTARRTLALMLAGKVGGTVIWISPAWSTAQLNAAGMLQFINPGRLVLVQPKRTTDILWSMEEALRSAATPLVVADLPETVGLTPVRRLHLAAETGARTGAAIPLGLLLTPEDGGAQGVESRWHMAPDHKAGHQAWQLDLRRARTRPPERWQLKNRNGQLCLLPVAPA